MTDQLYKETLETAKGEMELLLTDEEKLQASLSHIRNRIEVLQKTIASLSDLLGEDREPQARGITEAIRKLFRSQENPKSAWSALGVRNQLAKDGFKFSEYKNPLAMIHTTLKRLEAQKELESDTYNNRTYYKWVGSSISDEDIPF